MRKMISVLCLTALCLCFLSGKGLAEEKTPEKPEKDRFPADYHEAFTGPPAGKAIRKYADVPPDSAHSNFGRQPVHDNELFYMFKGDRFEYQFKDGEDTMLWDVQAWIGRDYNKIYIKSEGVWLTDREKFEEVGIEVLYTRNISTFWDLQAGIRHDFEPDPERTFAAFGFQGLAPYWFEVDATAYVSEDGDVSMGIEAEYELLLTQRLILQPRFETAIAVEEVREYGVGQGINDITFGLRLRYEIHRQFAPYAGISWSRKLGETADFAEAEGEDKEVTRYVAGVRFWF
jgi:copper resistance protein B